MSPSLVLRDRIAVPVRVSGEHLAARAADCRDPSSCPVQAALAAALPGAGRVAVYYACVDVERGGRQRVTARLSLPPEATELQHRLEAWRRMRAGLVVPIRDRVLLLRRPAPLAFVVWAPRWAVAARPLRWAS